jgi:uncharacterized membrane protein YdjX (TVP38/TMEM64 family)
MNFIRLIKSTQSAASIAVVIVVMLFTGVAFLTDLKGNTTLTLLGAFLTLTGAFYGMVATYLAIRTKSRKEDPSNRFEKRRAAKLARTKPNDAPRP